MEQYKRTPEEICKLENKINQLAKEWYNTPYEGNEAWKRATKKNIQNLILERYWNYDDYQEMQDKDNSQDINDAILKLLSDAKINIIDNYNPANGELTHYFSSKLAFRKIDCYKERVKSELVTKDWRNKANHIRLNKNLNQNQNGDSSDTREALISDADVARFNPDYHTSAYELNRLEELEKTAEFFMHILGMINRPEKKLQTRCEWLRLFYTQDMTYVIKQYLYQFNKEREIWEALDHQYLAYYMSEICHKFLDVFRSSLKPYGAVVPGKGQEEIPLPMPNDVILEFLKRERKDKYPKVGDSARSTQYGFYKEIFEEVAPPKLRNELKQKRIQRIQKEHKQK